ncbi:MAG: hypothetical protein ACJAUC_004547 [Planctomycetota bacterium]|jgi:hypothetical protein
MLFPLVVSIALSAQVPPQAPAKAQTPSRTEVIEPIHNKDFDRGGATRERREGGGAREVSGLLVFDGSMDGNRQVDPQIAVGGGFVLHGTNSGIVIYTKAGDYVKGVRQSGFNGGIDPKMFFAPHNRVFGFDLWNPWDKAKLKPVNISVSETDDPTGAWNTYPVPAPGGVDGGGIGFSQAWIGYSFPGGADRTFVLPMKEAKSGKSATAYHFAGALGHPVATQDPVHALHFVQVGRKNITVTRVEAGKGGVPQATVLGTTVHGLKYNGSPPQSPQKGSEQLTASGDRNPKNLVLQNGQIWFAQAVNCDGRSAVQWHQMKLDGTLVQTGIIKHDTSSYIQPTLAVNAAEDVLLGFQETSPQMFISPRLAFRSKSDPQGTLGDIVSLGEGQGATDGVSWGDYSGSVIDGDNLRDLWTIQSITGKDGKGDTVIARVPFGEETAAKKK